MAKSNQIPVDTIFRCNGVEMFGVQEMIGEWRDY